MVMCRTFFHENLEAEWIMKEGLMAKYLRICSNGDVEDFDPEAIRLELEALAAITWLHEAIAALG
jgi:hypothetical protein